MFLIFLLKCVNNSLHIFLFSFRHCYICYCSPCDISYTPTSAAYRHGVLFRFIYQFCVCSDCALHNHEFHNLTRRCFVVTPIPLFLFISCCSVTVRKHLNPRTLPPSPNSLKNTKFLILISTQKTEIFKTTQSNVHNKQKT